MRRILEKSGAGPSAEFILGIWEEVGIHILACIYWAVRHEMGYESTLERSAFILHRTDSRYKIDVSVAFCVGDFHQEPIKWLRCSVDRKMKNVSRCVTGRCASRRTKFADVATGAGGLRSR